MSDYVTLMVKVSKDDIREFLSNFYDEDDLDNMCMENEASECVNGILSDHFSDYWVVDKNTIMVGDF